MDALAWVVVLLLLSAVIFFANLWSDWCNPQPDLTPSFQECNNYKYIRMYKTQNTSTGYYLYRLYLLKKYALVNQKAKAYCTEKKKEENAYAVFNLLHSL